MLPFRGMFFEATPAPGLATLAALIGIIGGGSLFLGATDPDGQGESWWQKWLDSPITRIGLGVLGVPHHRRPRARVMGNAGLAVTI
jgi:hypothetical protein